MTIAEKPTAPTAEESAAEETRTPAADTAAADSDMALVERARNKDYAAFEELMSRYEDKVFRLAFRFVRNESEAKEILQDTFLAIWRKLDTFKGDSMFSSWVYRVAANAALMRLRTQRRHPEVSTEELPAGFMDQQQYGQILSPGENWARRPDDQLQSDELRRHIQSAVDALPEIYRTVFLVRDVEGLSTEETAELLGISIPTVKTRLHRARMALREAITGYFGKK
ncbi:MAG: polymerase sigma-70 factor, subfamily [Myxococcales bacterium]|jgi:RNA polymerase sigma-70 factor (ECF subfamily)|nr:polymerase sigma-70 factor, subfamily [Myxococcales bacterium]